MTFLGSLTTENLRRPLIWTSTRHGLFPHVLLMLRRAAPVGIYALTMAPLPSTMIPGVRASRTSRVCEPTKVMAWDLARLAALRT